MFQRYQWGNASAAVQQSAPLYLLCMVCSTSIGNLAAIGAALLALFLLLGVLEQMANDPATRVSKVTQ